MTFNQRLLLALVILICDILIFVIPVTAVFACYILLYRPTWFQEWILQLYQD
jgi:hypothetical protein